MRALRKNDWIVEREIKAEGKGRPMKVYRLSVPIEKIIQHYEEQKSQEAAQTMQAIQRLKEIASTWSHPIHLFCIPSFQLHFTGDAQDDSWR